MSLAAIRRAGQPAPRAAEAADWVLRQESGPLSEADQQAFEAWLAEDPAHAEAYGDAVWALDAAARHAAAPELMALREAALSARGDRPRRAWLWGGLGAVAASAAALWLVVLQPPAPGTPAGRTTAERADPNTAVYSTAIGERLAVTLPDGSVATLDTGSRLRVAYSGRERGVHLMRGQAMFEVAHGRFLPFNVHAAGQTITALGTTFNVRLYGDVVRVALIDGVVRVRSGLANSPIAAGRPAAPSPPRELVMRAGEMLQFGPAQPTRVARADVAQVASWRGGELVFDDVSLASAIAEINRYTTRPIAIGDTEVGEHRVTGVFRSNDPDRFASAMAEVFPITVTHAPDGAPIIRSRD